MNDYKRIWQDRLERVKGAASQLVGAEKEEELAFELEPRIYDRLKQIAEQQGTTVQAVIHHMLDQQLASQSLTAHGPVSEERKQQNPLLLLDGICGRDH